MGVYRAIRAWKVANPDVLPILDDGMWRPSGPPGDRGVLREVGSKGRLNQRGMASARLPSTETLSRGAGPGRIGSVGGSSSGGWSGHDLANTDGYTGRAGSPNVPNAEMVEAMERDPFGLGLGGGIGSRSSALHLNEDDYVERHASARVRVEHSHRAAYNAEHLLKDADARRVEVRRMEGAMGDHGSGGAARSVGRRTRERMDPEPVASSRRGRGGRRRPGRARGGAGQDGAVADPRGQRAT